MNHNTGGRQATHSRWADRLEAILRDEAGGMTFPQIVEALGLAESTARKAIAASAARGGALSLRLPTQQTLWWHKDNAAALHARCAELRRDRLDRSAARMRRKYWSDAEEKDTCEFETPFVHRIVPAHLARPLRLTGPTSVWGLAA